MVWLHIGPLTITCGVIYVILTISTTIFFFWNGFRIIVFFRATPRNDTRSRRLKNVSSHHVDALSSYAVTLSS